MKLKVKVIPNASRDQIVGLLNDSLKVKARLIAESGKANQAVVNLLAKQLSLSTSQIEIVSGQHSPIKP